jgi:hypothetical protein
MRAKKPSIAASGAGSITSLASGSPVLMGESAEVYVQALATTIQELSATTPLQIYLAEKIFGCLWWLRRYEQQKRKTLIRSMCEQLEPQKYERNMTPHKEAWFRALESGQLTPELSRAMAAKSHNLESLQQEAFDKCLDKMLALDELIAIKAKTLAGFQASFEALTNRKLISEKIKLQNTLMRKGLDALEHDKPAQEPVQ